MDVYHDNTITTQNVKPLILLHFCFIIPSTQKKFWIRHRLQCTELNRGCIKCHPPPSPTNTNNRRPAPRVSNPLNRMRKENEMRFGVTNTRTLTVERRHDCGVSENDTRPRIEIGTRPSSYVVHRVATDISFRGRGRRRLRPYSLSTDNTTDEDAVNAATDIIRSIFSQSNPRLHH